MPLRARLALALAVVINRPWAWLTLAAHYNGPQGANRAQRRAIQQGGKGATRRRAALSV